MSERRVPEGALVGVVGEQPAVKAAIEGCGGTPLVATPEELVRREPVAVVGVGEPALLSLARAGVGAPVLPVAAGAGVRSVGESDVGRAVEHLLAGEFEAVEYPVLGVGSTDVRVLMDLMVVTEAPAQISEFSVLVADRRIASVRADGVVVATPAGSRGYVRAAGGPVVAPGTGLVAVVPVAPFATDPDHWVLPVAEVALQVARDETTVELLADDRSVGPVTAGDPMELRRDGTFTVAVVPESRPFYDRGE